MSAPSCPERRRWLRAAAVLPLLAACQRVKPSFSAIDLTGAPYGRSFELPDADGRVRTLADFRGKLVVLFFGFTQCPDVCPSTLGELALIRQQLGADGARVQPVFITVDPERDTPSLLKSYMANFMADGVALRGTPAQTAAVAAEFKVVYNQVPGPTPTSYTVEHTAASFVFDTQGRLRLYARYELSAEALAQDLRTLLAEA